jgi:carbohydrate-selective porin OprB
MAAVSAIFRETALAMRQNEIDQRQVVTALASGLGRLAQRDLEYRIETEASYTLHPTARVGVTFDAQDVINPAYNRDRGPVGIIGLRLHVAV